MLRAYLVLATLIGVGGTLLLAQEESRPASGPRPGAFLPRPFECHNINGPAKGRQHCLVCKFALAPAVLIFAREQPADKDEALTELIRQLDETAAEFKDREFAVGVVFLSPDARDSTNNAAEEDPKKIIDETVKRDELTKRLQARAEPLKHAILAYYLPEGPAAPEEMAGGLEGSTAGLLGSTLGYNLNPKADITVLYYERMKVLKNWSFGPGKLQEAEVKQIVEEVKQSLPTRKKKAEAPPKM